MAITEKMKKLYTEKQLYVGTFLGGPLVAGIMAFKNFRRLGEPKKAERSILFTILFTVILFVLIYKLPENIYESIPNYVVPLINAAIVAFCFKKFLGQKHDDFFQNDGARESNWKVAGITGVGLIITLLIAVQLAFSQAAFPGDKLVFNNNEIYYDEQETSNEEVHLLADVLFSFGYFADDLGVAVQLESQDDRHTLTIPIDKVYWEDQQVIEELHQLTDYLEIEFEKEVKIKLEHYEFTGEVKKKFL